MEQVILSNPVTSDALVKAEANVPLAKARMHRASIKQVAPYAGMLASIAVLFEVWKTPDSNTLEQSAAAGGGYFIFLVATLIANQQWKAARRSFGAAETQVENYSGHFEI